MTVVEAAILSARNARAQSGRDVMAPSSSRLVIEPSVPIPDPSSGGDWSLMKNGQGKVVVNPDPSLGTSRLLYTNDKYPGKTFAMQFFTDANDPLAVRPEVRETGSGNRLDGKTLIPELTPTTIGNVVAFDYEDMKVIFIAFEGSLRPIIVGDDGEPLEVPKSIETLSVI
ncbi:hypothetical protein SISSUDRAFT_356159 [Sistotremastrum suecicum HHB10207 ss-3]|uniref:Uncharacterized protein n=1 Tax=Sistotremastrum suecicum HHB10207 ss-3 TaxID=1314776 RepID=A0A165Z8A5_9AGAM|nr:hypothetical protein SISSUDRAFT_356159 [Sistotremastrum suecicum HHB10207 ss-3]